LFRYWDETKNEGEYEFSEHTEKLEMEFPEFRRRQEDAEASSEQRLYLQQSLVEGVGEQILKDFKRFDWSLASTYQQEAKFGPLTSNLLLVGMNNVVTPAHYDEQENLFAQVYGQKRVILMSPNEFHRMYPFPVHHPCDRQSQVDIFNPDLCHFPKFADVEAMDCIVSPGDVLYIPAYWWHHIISLSETVSVNFWYKCGPKQVNAEAGANMRLSAAQTVSLRRNLERAVGDQAGPLQVRPFFAAVLTGSAEAEFPAIYQQVMHLLGLVMPADKRDGFLRGMAEGRYGPACNDR